METPENLPFGCKLLRNLRQLKGWNRKEMAHRLNKHVTEISQLECGRRPISELTARKLEDIFSIPWERFLLKEMDGIFNEMD